MAAVGWAGVGWNVNVPWLVQGRLVAIFGRDPGEVQARSRRDHKTIQIPSPVLACVSSTVFSAHFVSLSNPSAAEPATNAYLLRATSPRSDVKLPRTTGYHAVM